MLTLQEILQATSGIMVGDHSDRKISSVSIDSRCMRCHALFIAIVGEHHDGHQFIQQAIKNKAAAVLVSKKVKGCSLPMIMVKDTTKALGDIAHFYRQKFSIPIIAITGSAGKTTTKDMIAKVLSRKYKVLKTHRNLNNQFGLPLMMLQLRKHHQIGVFELGINQKGDMSYLAKILEPTMAIFTNVGASHLEKLKSLAGVAAEKTKLAQYLRKGGVMAWNADDPWYQKKFAGCKGLRFGIKRRCGFQAKDIQPHGRGQRFQVNNKSFDISGLGDHSIYNAVTAIMCGTHFKVSYNNIHTSIKNFRPEKNRGSWEKIGSIQLFNDTYNANPLSFRAALHSFRNQKTRGKRIVVCADMLELGPKAKKLHQDLAKELMTQTIDVVISFGKLAQWTTQALSAPVQGLHASTRSQLHQHLIKIIQPGDMILIKGSRSMAMEKTVAYLRKRFA